MLIAQIFVYAFYIYLLIGLLFGIWFVFSGVARVDAGMKEAGWKCGFCYYPDRWPYGPSC
jgi:uncharacterized membrane protein HdeD (DUF308 family)